MLTFQLSETSWKGGGIPARLNMTCAFSFLPLHTFSIHTELSCYFWNTPQWRPFPTPCGTCTPACLSLCGLPYTISSGCLAVHRLERSRALHFAQAARTGQDRAPPHDRVIPSGVTNSLTREAWEARGCLSGPGRYPSFGGWAALCGHQVLAPLDSQATRRI